MSESDAFILLIADDEIDRRAIIRAVRKRGIETPILEATDGVNGLALLRQMFTQPGQSHRLVVLLDLNMPRMGGIEFLQELRSDHGLPDVPVFVLTTSDDPQDQIAVSELQVAGYLLKSDHAGEEFLRLAAMLDQANLPVRSASDNRQHGF